MKTYTKTETIRRPKLVIENDSDCESPRKDSNLGYFITKDSNLNSPDDNQELITIMTDLGDYADSQEAHIKAMKKAINEQTEEKVLAIYSITKYQHSGIKYDLGTVHGFDNSNNGFYIITDKTQKEIGTKKKDFEKVIAQELEMYTQWVNGEVYQFRLYDNDGEIEESCGGFYSVEHIKEHLPGEWQDEDLDNYQAE